MRSSQKNAATAPSGYSMERPKLSRATRRVIRQAATLADEMKMHSFRVHSDGSITWTRRLENQPSQPEPPSKGARSQPSELSTRQQRSRDRGIAHRALLDKAQNFRVRSFLNFWRRQATRPPPPPPLPPPPPPSVAL